MRLPAHYAHAPESPVWVAFARLHGADDDDGSQGMAEIVVGNERRTLKVLDIAAGTGCLE